MLDGRFFMSTFILRFADLKQRKIVLNWPALRFLIKEQGFPPGKLLSPNRRGWPEEEVEQWLKNRPTGSTPLKGAAKENRADRIAADAGSAEASQRLKLRAGRRRARIATADMENA
jgi:hypothetical protein